jgi:hypothetical protein
VSQTRGHLWHTEANRLSCLRKQLPHAISFNLSVSVLSGETVRARIDKICKCTVCLRIVTLLQYKRASGCLSTVLSCNPFPKKTRNVAPKVIIFSLLHLPKPFASHHISFNHHHCCHSTVERPSKLSTRHKRCHDSLVSTCPEEECSWNSQSPSCSRSSHWGCCSSTSHRCSLALALFP